MVPDSVHRLHSFSEKESNFCLVSEPYFKQLLLFNITLEFLD